MHLDRPHKKLDAWKVALELCKEVYVLCESLPPDERFSMATQLRRVAVSVPSNIAEGAARGTVREFAHFLSVAQGSLAELDTQLELCSAYLGLIDREEATKVLEKRPVWGA
ncbi:four helix bundle protein [Deferrisoma camini]|uniref:four helix bundle protein n=1 Tax=Deferrisoma camini TaxID=1035120 RepID=UPI00046D8D32|nr:four helix bundle protein [Deferrisoma camini]